MKNRIPMLLGVAGLLAGPAFGQSLIIDDFDTDESDEDGLLVMQQVNVGSNPFGLPTAASLVSNSTAVTPGDVGLLNFSAGSGVDAELVLDYDVEMATLGDGFDGLLPGLFFEADFAFTDFAFQLEVVVEDTDTGTTDSDLIIVPASDSFQVAQLLIGDDVITDLETIDRITFTFNPLANNGVTSLDFTLLELTSEVVPTPGMMAIAATGGLVMARRRRG